MGAAAAERNSATGPSPSKHHSVHNGRPGAKALEELPSANNPIREIQSQVEHLGEWMYNLPSSGSEELWEVENESHT